jgi:hypothetical protein
MYYHIAIDATIRCQPCQVVWILEKIHNLDRNQHQFCSVMAGETMNAISQTSQTSGFHILTERWSLISLTLPAEPQDVKCVMVIYMP